MNLISQDILENTKEWFNRARPEPTPEHFSAQTAVHFEEVGEMIDELVPVDDATREALADARIALTHLRDHLKRNPGCIEIKDRILFIDAICDQLVTATGSAHCAGMQPVGALNAVNISNFSKFDEDGNPIFDENMKVIKGPNYQKADLSPFV